MNATYSDGSISLYVVNVLVVKAQLMAATADGADDASCHCVTQLVRAAHGNHKLSCPHGG